MPPRHPLSLTLLASLLTASALADVTLPAIFSDHAVLRRAEQVPIWGTATPGEAVTVSLASKTAATTAGADGKWSVVLNLADVGPDPLELTVTGKNKLSVRDVLVGEVWLASGQSNMAFGMGGEKHAKTELPKAANPRLRLFTVTRKGSGTPEADLQGKWEVASPESGRLFSAVGYYFGQAVQRELGVPVGIICAAQGGSVAQAWTSAEALATVPDMKATYLAQWAKIKSYDSDKAATPEPTPAALASNPKPISQQLTPRETSSSLYNAMIHPLIPYSLSGVIWYQGESNKNFAWQYRTAFPLLIQSWRKEWGQEFPFYFCQMHNQYAKEAQPIESEGAELREAQNVALALPKTGMAVTIDLGEEDIHPKNKKDVGERLAAVALVKSYGKTMPYSGPVYTGVKKVGTKLVVSFSHTEGGLVAKPVPATHVVSGTKTAPLVRNSPDSPLEGFAICGADKKWVWAQAKIVGDTVEVWADTVKDPLAVRYAWAINPTCNLYNGEGLPAGPFRSDDFPAKTIKAKFAGARPIEP